MKLRAILLSTLLVASLLVGGLAFAGGAAAAPSGMVTIPDSQISEDVPDGQSIPLSANELESHVLVDEYPDTLEVVLTTPGHADELMGPDANVIGDGEMAIVLRDNSHDAGRDVAIEAGLLRDALGYSPEMIHGTHSSGDTWKSPASYEDGYLRFHIEEFSSNTVTFAGEFRATGTFSDSSQVQEELSNLDAASNVTVNLTGEINTETDFLSQSEIRGDVGFTVAGNADPGDLSAEITPKPKIPSSDREVSWPEGTNSLTYEWYFPDIGGTITEVSVYTATYLDVAGGDGSVYIAPGNTTGDSSVDGDAVEIGSFNIGEYEPSNTKWRNYSASSNFSAADGVTLEIEGYTDSSTDGNDHWSVENVALTSPAPQEATVGTGGSEKSLNLSAGKNSTTFPLSGTGDKTLSVSYLNGTTDANISWTEKSVTENPGVELNSGNWANHTGTLADGETTSLTINKSALVEGTNTYTVDLPTLSADAPPMQVQAEISHSAEDDKVVDYEAEKFSERYNVSKTYADAGDNPSLTIPFADEVTSMRALEYRTNGGTWQDLTDYSLDNTTLTANLPDADAGDTHTVRANASKVTVWNGDIKVTDPTAVGEDLETKFDITSKSAGDFQLQFGGQPDELVHYAESSTTTTEDYYHAFANSENSLVMPAAGQGDSYRVETIPVSVTPQTNDVAIGVPNPKSTEPEFNVHPSNSAGDEVEFTYEGALDDQKYMLWSQTHQVVRDSGTANSPLTLLDDDSDETLQFLIENTTASSTDGSDSVLGPVPTDTSDVPLPSGTTLAIIGLLGAGVVGVLYWRGGTEAVASAGKSTAGASASALGYAGRVLRKTVDWLRSRPYAAATLGGIIALGLLATGVISLPPQTATYLVVVAVPIAAYWVLIKQLGASQTIWAGVSIGGILLGFQLLGTDVLGTFTSWQGSIILLVGGLYIAYQGVKAARAPEEVNDITIRGD